MGEVRRADRLRRRRKAREAHLTYDADDRVGSGVAPHDAPPERILARPQLRGEALVDDGDAQTVFPVDAAEVPSSQQTRPHRFEIAGRHGDHGRERVAVGHGDPPDRRD
jgi:hypothetical protein